VIKEDYSNKLGRSGAQHLRLWQSCYRQLLRWSKRLTFLAVALYAAFQWYGLKVDGQVKQVLTFYDKYNSEPIIGYRKDLDLLLNDKELSAAVHSGDQNVYMQRVVELTSSEKGSVAFDIMSDFFNGLSVCVATHLCQEDVAARLFQPAAMELYDDYGPYLGYIRSKNGVPSFGSGIIEFASKTPKPNTFLRSLYDFVF
jgi:hypothetical protein